MKCCHTLQQASELVYINTMAGLDIFNILMMILSTSTPIGGLPLAIMLTFIETTNSFTKALDMLKCIMPISAFNRHGPVIGPKVFITNGCKAENSIDSKHGINKNDHIALIKYLKKIVFARTENRFKEERYKKWAIAYCQHLPIQDNHTNNFSEPRIWVIKDAIFDRIQAYNIVQIFYFIINLIDLYYIHKLLAIAHNKLDNFIVHCFQLSGWQIGLLDDIKVISYESII
ncbi:24762_t:CDS:2 [Gigaspora margarita]|uniref:24762_t:CDS:1 n=1 Tax=Gigaspora margarita TaxID=4874 RepID=A0ABN7UMJ6_GIGMA|nr:24762_t:CDS:2 [Gigaspora margarita]